MFFWVAVICDEFRDAPEPALYGDSQSGRALGDKMAPRGHSRAEREPKRDQDEPKTAQDRPKRAPRRPKRRTKGPQEAPRWHKIGPR